MVIVFNDEVPTNSSLTEQDKKNIEILKKIKHHQPCDSLNIKQQKELRSYLAIMKPHAHDNFEDFYETIKEFYLYKKEISLSLNSFWQTWLNNDFHTNPQITHAVICSETLEEACASYITQFEELHLKSLKSKIVNQFTEDQNAKDKKLFLQHSDHILKRLIKNPDDIELEKLITTGFPKVNPFSKLEKNIAHYIRHLTKLNKKVRTMKTALTPFYVDDSLIFANDFQNWMSQRIHYFHYTATHTYSQLLTKGIVWLTSTLGVYDILHSIINSNENASSSFDWLRLLVCSSIATAGTAFWSKLDKIEKARDVIISRMSAQLDELVMLTRIENKQHYGICGPHLFSRPKNLSLMPPPRSVRQERKLL